jgi:hypothetical protein
MPGLSLYPGNRFQLSAALGLIDGRSPGKANADPSCGAGSPIFKKEVKNDVDDGNCAD